MTRLKLHYAMQKWYPVDFMGINLGINLLRVQDATFTVYTVFNFEPKWCKKRKIKHLRLSRNVFFFNYLKLYANLIF